MSATPILLLLAACGGSTTVPPLPDLDLPDTTPVDPIFHDPLSVPPEPTLDPEAFASAETCQECHAEAYAEWRTSMHAYAMVDPVFQALVGIRQVDLDGTQDGFCLQCHSAIATRGGEIVPGFAFGDLSPIAMEGITCTSCHTAVAVARDYNSGHVLDPAGPLQGPITDPVHTPAHGSEGSALFDDSLFCGACHDVIEVSGLDLERPYREWTESPSAESGQSCQDCHMRTVRRAVATGGPERTAHEHRWVGVDVPYVDGWITDAEEEVLRQGIVELLATAATMEIDAAPSASDGQLDVTITVENRIPAHNLPTGSTFLRQVWVELTATDATGTVLYRTGDLDGNGDLRNYWSSEDPYGDADLISLSSGFVDPLGEPTLFPWIAAEHQTGALAPLYSRTWTLFVPTAGAVGPVHVDASLRFRSLPPYLVRALGLPGIADELQIYDLAADAIDVDLGA